MKEIMNRKVIKKDLKDHGFKLITIKTGNRHTLLKYRCLDCGTEFKAPYVDWALSNKTCCRCYDKPYTQTIETVYFAFKLMGYELLNEVYGGVAQTLTYVSPEGELGYTDWNTWRNAWKTDRGFVHVSNTGIENVELNRKPNRKHTVKTLTADFKSKGLTLLSKEYVNTMTSLDYVCDKGHYGSVTCHRFYDYEVRNADKGGFQCPECKKNIIKTVKVFNTKPRNNEQWTLLDGLDSFVKEQRINKLSPSSKEQIKEVLWREFSKELGV